MKFDDVGMIEHFVDDVLSLDFFGLDREKDFNGDFFSVFFIVAFENVRVFSPAEFLNDGIVLDLSV